MFAWRLAFLAPRASSFDDRQRAQLRNPRAHTRRVDDPHDVGDILVGLRSLFGHRGQTSGPHMDTASAELRLIRRPAPWQVEPNVSRIAWTVPTNTYEYRPMSPGTSTG